VAHLKSDTEWTAPYVEKILFLPIIGVTLEQHANTIITNHKFF